VRLEVVVNGTGTGTPVPVMTVLENVQSRGALVDLFLGLRDKLTGLRAGLGPNANPPTPLGEPFNDLVNRILDAGEKIKRGQTVVFDDVFNDIKGLATTVVDAFQTLFGQIAKGQMPDATALM